MGWKVAAMEGGISAKGAPRGTIKAGFGILACVACERR
jgi:hypothetical protein